MSLVSCHNQSNRETHPSSAEEKVNDYIFDDVAYRHQFEPIYRLL
jgi:hypothetical protein